LLAVGAAAFIDGLPVFTVDPAMSPDRPPLYLKPQEDRRLRAGYLWVYSNEVDTDRSPLSAFEPGQAVDIMAHAGSWLASGYVNPHSLICARVLSREPALAPGPALLTRYLKTALRLRERLYGSPYYRWVFGESDALPGLIIDRYADTVVVQIGTAGMERLREEILTAIEKLVHPACIVLRNDAEVRALEGLPAYVEVARGDAPEEIEVEESGARLHAPLLQGQKTGWYYDQRDNRRRLTELLRGRRVLDLFSYVGAWGIQAARAGAERVVCVDSSARALECAARNAVANGVAAQLSTVQGDAMDVLAALRAEHEHFDCVILDPPAFIKRKKALQQGVLAYRRLNQAALQLLSGDGLLVSCSCSYHLEREGFLPLVHQAARHVDRRLQLLAEGQQAPDHPILPAMPETRYLKALFLRTLLRY
jgi:23S rRNA (cytosine1962-C5)-methyltransferase